MDNERVYPAFMDNEYLDGYIIGGIIVAGVIFLAASVVVATGTGSLIRKLIR